MKQSEWQQVLADLGDIEDFKRYEKALAKLASVTDKSLVPDLYRLLWNRDWGVQEAAACSLVGLEGAKALSAFLDAIERASQEGHDCDGLWTCTAIVLEQHRQEATPMLLAILDQPITNAKRANVLWALGYVSSDVPVDVVLAALEDESPEVRVAAAVSLEGFPGSHLVVDRLIGLLDDHDEEVRAAAVSTLGHLGNRRAVPALLEAQRDSSERVRTHATHALKQLGVKP
jgi:HEAT repeat protein